MSPLILYHYSERYSTAPELRSHLWHLSLHITSLSPQICNHQQKQLNLSPKDLLNLSFYFCHDLPIPSATVSCLGNSKSPPKWSPHFYSLSPVMSFPQWHWFFLNIASHTFQALCHLLFGLWGLSLGLKKLCSLLLQGH